MSFQAGNHLLGRYKIQDVWDHILFLLNDSLPEGEIIEMPEDESEMASVIVAAG